MLRFLVLIALAGCGRLGFEEEVGPPAYHDVQPVYITGHAMPALVPTGGGEPWTISPALPAGLAIDPAIGNITGTPAIASGAALYTISTRTGDTTIRLRTADGFVVNDAGDQGDATPGDDLCEVTTGSNVCTLRAVTEEINATKAKHVVFIAVPQVKLAATLPAFAAPIELVGMSAAATTIDANHVGRLAIGGANVTLTLSYLSYRNNAGELDHGFNANVSVVVDHAELRDNQSLFNVAGGATLRLVDSTIANNTGILVRFSGAMASIERCTVANNTSDGDPQFYFVSGTAQIESSTFSGNSGVYPPVLYNNTTGTIRNSTFVGNGSTASSHGGALTVYSNGSVALINNLFVNNIGFEGACKETGTITSGGGNLLWPEEPFNECHAELSLDPLLEPLADNGGPTMTHALAADSPAIDAAGPDCGTADQRGVTRPRGNGCDIGAFEHE